MRWVKTWLGCVAWYLPLWWLSELLLLASAALSGALALNAGHDQADFWLGALRVLPGSPGLLGFWEPWRLGFGSYWTALLALAGLGGFTALARRTGRLLGGLAFAALAQTTLIPLLLALEFRRSPAGTPNVAVRGMPIFVCLCMGLWWVLSAWELRGYWRRATSLLATVGLPPLALLFATRFYRGPFWLSWLAIEFAPLTAAVLLMSFRGSRPGDPFTTEPGWKPAAIGGITTALLVAGIVRGGPALVRAIEESRLARNRAAMAHYPPNPVNAPYPKIFFQKGVSFTAEFPDPYASEGARQMLEALSKFGVNAVALVPFGWTEPGSAEVHGFGQDSLESNEGIREMARVAHALGMKVMLKPGMWVRGAGYAGDLEFSSAAKREQWLTAYGKFIERYARLATEVHADIFCVGGEFVHLSQDDAAWRKIIAQVRAVYAGPLTYAANFGGEFESIKFWDALDFIGLQEYYPLPDNLSTDAVVAKVEAVEKKFGKPVIFTEAGFPSMEGANLHPWDDRRGPKISLALQARCYDAIFRAFYKEPWFEGMYWWKVGTNGFGGPDDSSLTLWGKPAMEVVKRWYAGNLR